MANEQVFLWLLLYWSSVFCCKVLGFLLFVGYKYFLLIFLCYVYSDVQLCYGQYLMLIVVSPMSIDGVTNQ